MKPVFVVQDGDQLLSSASLEVRGVYETSEDARAAIIGHLFDDCNKKGVKKFVEGYWSESYEEGDELNQAMNLMFMEIARQLSNSNQTQGLEVNYMISEYNLNEWV